MTKAVVGGRPLACTSSRGSWDSIALKLSKVGKTRPTIKAASLRKWRLEGHTVSEDSSGGCAGAGERRQVNAVAGGAVRPPPLAGIDVCPRQSKQQRRTLAQPPCQ